MTRGTWVWDKDQQKLVPKAEFYRNRPQELRSDFPVPMLNRGQLDDVWNPIDGKRYSTLRNYEKAIPKGAHIIEQGEGAGGPPEPSKRDVEQTIADTWDQIESGYKQ
jgi:hypothetical protein